MKLIYMFMLTVFVNCTFNYTLHDYDKYIMRIKTLTISDRVGETIDTLERKQFNLFPGIKNFESAVFYELQDGSYTVSLVAGGQKYLVTNRDDMGIEIMREYINDYEKNQEIQTGLMRNRRVVGIIQDTLPVYEKVKTPFEKKWDIVDYDDLGLPITKHEIRKFSQNTNQRFYTAGFCVTSGIIGFWITGVVYYRQNVLEGANALPGILCCTGIATITAMGHVMGKNADEKAIIMAIKEARKPRLVETYE